MKIVFLSRNGEIAATQDGTLISHCCLCLCSNLWNRFKSDGKTKSGSGGETSQPESCSILPRLEHPEGAKVCSKRGWKRRGDTLDGSCWLEALPITATACGPKPVAVVLEHSSSSHVDLFLPPSYRFEETAELIMSNSFQADLERLRWGGGGPEPWRPLRTAVTDRWSRKRIR